MTPKVYVIYRQNLSSHLTLAKLDLTDSTLIDPLTVFKVMEIANPIMKKSDSRILAVRGTDQH